MISSETIQKVKDLPIVTVVDKYIGNLKKSGANYVCSCPWHKDKHPSFTVSPSKGIASCFVCDKTLNGIGLVMDLKNLSYPMAVKEIANDFGIKIVETYKKEASDEEKKKYQELEALVIANTWAADWYHNNLLAAIDKYYPEEKYKNYRFLERNYCCSTQEHEVIHYIMMRFKGSVDLIKKFKIGYAPYGYKYLYEAAVKAGFKLDVLERAGLVKQKTKGVVDSFIFRPLVFPIHSIRGSVVGFSARKMPWDNSKSDSGREYPKFINTAETPIYKKSKLLYGFDFKSQGAIRKADKVYIVEGNTDKTSLAHISIDNVVAKSGTALTDEQIDNIKKLTKNVCLVDDGDNAGQLSMQKNGEKLTRSKCNVTVLTLPDGDDPDSYFESEEHFRAFENESERDFIIDVIAIEGFAGLGNNIQQKKKHKEFVAELLIEKPQEDREEYINEIIKGTSINRSEWTNSIKKAAFSVQDKGLNIAEENEDEKVSADNSSENQYKHNFYYVKKNKQKDPTGIEIDERMFLLKLKSIKDWEFDQDGKITTIYFGFYTYSVSSDESDLMFVQLMHGRIKQVSINYIKKAFFKYVRLLKPFTYEGFGSKGDWEYTVTNKMIETMILKKVTTLFEEKRLVLFPDKSIRLLKDTIYSHYTFFKNCYVISDRNGYQVKQYEDLKEGYVWDDAVLDRDFHEPKDSQPGVFEQFVHDISGNEWDIKEMRTNMPDEIRYKAHLIAGGYMLHNFTELKRKAVIFTQGRISEEDTSDGREGKTLFVEALGKYMLNKNPDESTTFKYIPGKDLKADDKHKWQDLNLNTTLVLYDDPPSFINFESLYNVAERAFKVEKKNEANLYIKARIAITTNRPLNRDSGSSRDRSCVIELDSIFSEEYSPGDKYNQFFFRDWKGDKQDEWNKFSKYVLGKMLPAYFKNNCVLLEPPSKNLYRNELLQSARRLLGGVEVVFWLDFLCKGDKDTEPFFKIGEIYRSKELLDKYIQDQDIKDIKRIKRNFSTVLTSYFAKESIAVEKERDLTGTTFKMLSGLPEKIVIDQNFVADFFNNGDYKVADLESHQMIKQIVSDFNSKYEMKVGIADLKSVVKEMSDDLPF